jgi:hypothetical protein
LSQPPARWPAFPPPWAGRLRRRRGSRSAVPQVFPPAAALAGGQQLGRGPQGGLEAAEGPGAALAGLVGRGEGGDRVGGRVRQRGGVVRGCRGDAAERVGARLRARLHGADPRGPPGGAAPPSQAKAMGQLRLRPGCPTRVLPPAAVKKKLRRGSGARRTGMASNGESMGRGERMGGALKAAGPLAVRWHSSNRKKGAGPMP